MNFGTSQLTCMRTVSLLTGCPLIRACNEHMTFCGPARDTVLPIGKQEIKL